VLLKAIRVAFSSIIFESPISIEKAKRMSQNSYFSLACLNVTCLPFRVINLSVSVGFPSTFFMLLALPWISENDITGTAKFNATIISRRLRTPI